MIVAHQVGIRVFATGGIGGVHHGTDNDVSADLPELSQTPVAVVCAGAKSILDLPRTLEWLETFGVPVLGYGTSEFPAFYTSQSVPLHESMIHVAHQ
jgi:pseudouridine-5'-phosphate glycosidase